MSSASPRATRIHALAFALLGAAMLVPGVRGSIVYQDIPDVHLSTFGSSSGDLSTYLDLDGDGANDFQFELRWNNSQEGFQRTDVYSLRLIPGVVYRGMFGGFPTTGAEALQAGFLVQPNLEPPPLNNTRSWTASPQLAVHNVSTTDHGWWSGQAYLGVRFAQTDGNHYGWIDMSASSGSVDIFRFGYESTPDTPIGAGAVPGPGTWLLGVGLMGAAARRRRRDGAALASCGTGAPGRVSLV